MAAPGNTESPNARVFNIHNCETVNIGTSVAMSGQPSTPCKTLPREKIRKLLKYKRNPTTREFRLVAENLGRYWWSVGEEMGFSWAYLDNIDYDERRQVDKCHKLLRDWYDWKDDEATLSLLIQHLIKANAYYTLGTLVENIVLVEDKKS